MASGCPSPELGKVACFRRRNEARGSEDSWHRGRGATKQGRKVSRGPGTQGLTRHDEDSDFIFIAMGSQ